MTDLATFLRPKLRTAWLLLALAAAPAFAAPATAPAAAPINNVAIVSDTPMQTTVENDRGTYGQLIVAPAILSSDMPNELAFTITMEPRHGRVGLAGEGDATDFYKVKTSRFGYYAYQPDDDYAGPDSFGYTVRNATSGLEFKNTVMINVTSPHPVTLDKVVVNASPLLLVNAQPVTITTRPNTPVTRKLPSHEAFMSPAAIAGFGSTRVVYRLDDKAKPRHGAAKLDPATGELTYSPDPGFTGDDVFKYYTIDQNHAELGMENAVDVSIEPIRHPKHITVDRAHSREVDLVFVINNSPSMAAHQQRLADSLTRFRRLFNQRNLDYRIAVLTTDFINRDPGLSNGGQPYYKSVKAVRLDANGRPVLNAFGHPKHYWKHVATNGNLVTLPGMPEPWVTPATPDGTFAELVKVGANGNRNRTAFTAVYNFVSNYYHGKQSFLRPDAATFVVLFMDEEETRMAVWQPQPDGTRRAEWIEDGTLPELIKQYNARHPRAPETLDGYINQWVLRPFIIAKGNKRGSIEVEAVVSPNDISHRRAAELTGGTVLNIDSDFSAPLAALGDRIAETVAVPLDPPDTGFTIAPRSFRVLVDGQPVSADPQDGFTYDPRTNSVRFHGAAKQRAFLARIDITYEEQM